MSTIADMVNLRYDVIQELGSGGSGIVFLVEDILRGRLRCALKALRTGPAPPSLLAASRTSPDAAPTRDPGKSEDLFLNEIAALLELRHPLLVSLYDFGTITRTDRPSIQGCRYFTMEYVQGGDALEFVRNQPAGPERGRLLELLLAQALSVLSYLHARGIVHYDIKPQNLLIAGGAPSSPILKLSDFGFSRKETGGQVPLRGTLEYTAPELLLGENADRRIDLYSLGATFFHLVEGRCPFEAHEPVDLIKKVLSREVAFDERLWRDMPVLRRAVMALLERDPAQRPASAREALGFLDTSNLSFPGDDACHAIHLPFVGRSREREQITGSMQALFGTLDLGLAFPASRRAAPGRESEYLELGPGDTETQLVNAYVIYGPEGMGKTRLVEEVARDARIRGLRLFTLEAIAGGVPFQGLSSFIRALKLEIGSLPGKRTPGIPAAIDRIFPEDKPLPEVGDSPQTRQADIEAVASFVVESADHLRMMIVAEDLENLDSASQRVLETIARDMPPGRALLLMTGASEKVWPAPSPRLCKLSLPELDLQDVVTLAQAVAADPAVAAELAQTIVRTLGAMPLVVIETLRSYTACGSLDEAVGMGIDELLLRRYAALTREKQLLFSFLCCFSYPASRTLLQQLLPFQIDRFQAAARSLEGEGLIGTVEQGK
ncbi:MAG TPA: serine/threonine-protein kinase, partial [Bacteroidota bacterium]